MMRKLIPISLLLGLFITLSCGERAREVERVMNTYEDGQPELVMTYKVRGSDTTLVMETHHHPDGSLSLRGSFDAEGRKEGTWTAWFRNGQKNTEAVFEDDEEQGLYTVWHANGQVYYQGMMEDGRRTGTWKFYTEEGDLDKQIDY